MSKQYLTTHTIDNAHATDIFALVATPTTLISASGASGLKVYSTTDPTFPLIQTIPAHKLGCHHLALSASYTVLASAGFEGSVKIWLLDSTSQEWSLHNTIQYTSKVGEIWALALSDNGSYLAGTTHDGKILVWDVSSQDSVKKIQEYETKGSFGMSVAMSSDGRFTASGHENGGLYIFNNDTGRMAHSLPSLMKPVRTLSFSPRGTRLAAAGDVRVISLFDTLNGEQVANLSGHTAWIFSIDWSDTGEFLLSGSFDGKAKVWNVETSTCVATHSETEKTVWSVKWLPKTGRSDMFATAGANRSISFYREATGG